MRNRSLSLPIVVALLLAALVIGASGSATAGSLTKKAVKKIAAQVVAKQAPQLTVAKATRADSAAKADSATRADSAANADTLGGQPPATYENRVLRVPLRSLPGAQTLRWSLPAVPAGAYEFSISAAFQFFDGATSSYCRLRATDAQSLLLLYGTTIASATTYGGSRIVELSGAPLELQCTATGAGAGVMASSPGLQEGQVSFAPVTVRELPQAVAAVP